MFQQVAQYRMNAVTGMLILYIITDALVSQIIRINICHITKKRDEKFFPLSSLSFPYSMTRLLIADGKGKCLLLCAQLHSYVVETFCELQIQSKIQNVVKQPSSAAGTDFKPQK